MANKYSVLIEAKLDPIASEAEINRNIATLQTKINSIALNITIDDSKLETLKNQIQAKLSNIGVGVSSGAASSGGGGPSGPGPGGVGVPSEEFSSNMISSRSVYNAAGDTELARQEKYRQSLQETLTVMSSLKEGEEGLQITSQVLNNEVEKGTKFNDKLNDVLQKLSVTQEKLKLSPVASTGGIPQPKAIQDVNDALNNYSNLIKGVQTRGGPITTEDLANLKQAENVYKNSVDSLRLYEQQQSNLNKKTSEQTSTLKSLTSEYKRLEEIQSKISSSRLKQALGSTNPEAKQIQDLQIAAKNYKVLVDEINAKGNIVGEDDKLRIAQARIELEKTVSALKQEELALSQIATAQQKNNQLIKQHNKDVDNQIKDAQKLAASTQSLLVGKSGDNKQVKEAERAIIDLKKAINDLTIARKIGKAEEDKARESLEKTVIATEKAAGAVRTVGKNANSWVTEIGVAIKRTIEWAGAMTLLYGSLRQVERGIKYIKDLNKELVNIQLVTGASSESAAELSIQYNNLAKELGATTLEVTKGSLEWSRQGKTADETAQLLRASVMMGKLANIEQAQSTEYLTSIINGYKLSMDEVIPTIDKLVALDNSMATSTSELAEAMQRSANSARLAGIPLENLAAMIGTVSSVTRKSAESIGESFN